MHFVFWQNQVSMHQSACLRALVARGHSCRWVVDAADSPDRKQMGWTAPDTAGIEVVVAPDERQCRAIWDDRPEDTVHLLTGFRGANTARWAWRQQGRQRRRLGFLAEGADVRGLKGLLRRLIYSWEGVRRGRRAEIIMAMGENGVRWYRRCFFPADRILPFAYTVERFEPPSLPSRPDGRFQIVFVGSLIVRKGVDLLAEAFGRLGRDDARLTFVGDGPLRGALDRIIARCGCSSQVAFTGNVSNAEARARIAAADLLVLPSRFDGWGAVVNEALMLGTPVVCSDRCGARDLLDGDLRGDVYRWNRVDQLCDALKRRIAAGPIAPETRAAIRRWSASAISGEAVAEYLIAAVRWVFESGPRTAAPWTALMPPQQAAEVNDANRTRPFAQ